MLVIFDLQMRFSFPALIHPEQIPSCKDERAAQQDNEHNPHPVQKVDSIFAMSSAGVLDGKGAAEGTRRKVVVMGTSISGGRWNLCHFIGGSGGVRGRRRRCRSREGGRDSHKVGKCDCTRYDEHVVRGRGSAPTPRGNTIYPQRS